MVARLLQPGVGEDTRGAPPIAPSADQDKLRLFLAISRATVAYAARTPLVLFLDDLHWADQPSMELLSHLVFSTADAAAREAVRLLIVATYRADELAGATARMVTRLQREENCTRFDLEGLSDAEVGELMESLGLPPVSRQLTALVTRTSGGNPLFVQELAHHLSEQGALQERGGYLVTTVAPDTLRLPDDLGAAIGGRTASVSPRCRRILTLAAFLGAGASVDTLRAVSASSEADVLAAIQEGMEKRLLQPEDPGVQFAHPIVRQAFYTQPNPVERQRIHRRIAERLERSYAGRSDAHLLEIAQHIVDAGQAVPARRTIEYARRAGDRAFDIFAWTEAGRFYEAALAAAATLAPAHVLPVAAIAALHERAAWAHYRAFDVGPCRDQFDRAVAAYEQAGDVEHRAEALLGKTRAAFTLASIAYGAMVDTEPLEAVLVALGEREPLLRGRIAQTLSEVYWHGRQTAKAEAMGRQAIAIGEQLDDDRLCAEAYHGLALAHMQSLRIREALDLWERSLAFARKTGDPWVQSWPLPRMSLALLWLGDVDRAEEVARESCELTRQIHNWAEYSVALAQLVSIAVLRGEFAAAEQHARECMALVGHSRYPWGGVAALTALACARALRGAWDEADDAVAALVEPGRVFDEPGPAMQFTAWVYRLLIAAGRDASGGASAETVGAIVAALGQEAPDMGAVAALCALVEIGDRAADPQVAGAACPGLVLAEEHGVVIPYGWVCLIPRVLGVAATLREAWEEAERHFEQAAALAQRVGAQPELARTYLDHARALAARQNPLGRTRARAFLAQAHALSGDLRMQPVAQQCEQLAEALGAPLPPATSGAGTAALTDVEIRLLQSIARGRTDQEIADQLLVGSASLAARIERLFRKIGVQQRAAAAHYAETKGLLAHEDVATNHAIAPGGFRTILFTDMAGSTAAIQQLGDDRAQAIMRIHNRVVRDCLGRHQGTEVKHTGDGVMAMFASASQAIACAVAMQRAFAEGAHEATALPIRVRIGLNAGEPLAEEGDFYGAAVNATARICARAQPGQILATEVIRQLAIGKQWVFVDRGRVTLKGFPRRFHVYEVEVGGESV